jgi:hypothetical protein
VIVDVVVVNVVVVNVVRACLLGLLKIRSFPGDNDDDVDDDDRLRRGHEDVAPTHVHARAAPEDVVN